MSVRIGVIGVGVHGLHHVRLLSKMDDVDLTSIFDINLDKAFNTAREFDTAAFANIDALLENSDCVTVAVPTPSHFDVVTQCFEHGRHVLVEKPIAVTPDEARRLNEDAKKRGLILAVGHIERFNSAYRSVKEYVGSPLFIESHRIAVFNPRGTDVAVVLDLMIHDIDIILNMIGRPVETVSAVGVPVVSDEVDIANARLEFEGGCVANLTASRISQRKMRKIRTFQQNSYVSMDFLTGASEVFSLRPDAKPSALPGAIPQLMDGILYKQCPNDEANALELELADFVKVVTEGGKPQVSGEDGLAALDVAARVMESMEVSRRRIE